MVHKSPPSRRACRKYGGVFDVAAYEARIATLEAAAAAPDFWSERARAEALLAELKTLRATLEPWRALRRESADLRALYELAREAQDASLEPELSSLFSDISARFEEASLTRLLHEEVDRLDAFVTIHSGAGGVEACDWAQMLMRMYTRWAERRSFCVHIVDLLESEGGVKSVTLKICGSHAFGFLKGETGVHRLVRISPFDSAARRHTSFTSTYVFPVLDDHVEVHIRSEDMRVDTYRSGGAGGQHVNKTDSAVRITHLPTGIVVTCQNERSQISNRATALSLLRARLYAYERQKKQKEHQRFASEKKDISWGNQIRSYVFHPYTMVKDHRSKCETGNIHAVMDGALEPFIRSYLEFLCTSTQCVEPQ